MLAVLPVEDVTHGLGHAALPVDVELVQGVVHGVGQAHDAWENISGFRENTLVSGEIILPGRSSSLLPQLKVERLIPVIQ